jgi:GPH family glycoside/pentoside/hexuronide:cation symporter
MSKTENDIKKKKFSYKRGIAYSIGQVSDITSYQTFVFLVFTFYFAIVGISITLIMIGFIIWALWNSFNDFLIGYLSDRTHTKWGRRIPYILISLIPLSIILFFLFTPIFPIGIEYQIANFIYFLIIIIIFELFFTMYDLNYTALFPELFISVDERTKANNLRQAFAIIGLIMAFVLPGLFITDYSDPQNLVQYQTFGIVIAIIVVIPGALFLKFSPKEKAEFHEDYKKAPGFIDAIKTCVKSKSFMWYIPAEVANWFVYGILPAIVPLYGKYVLHITNTLILSLLLGIAFISAAIFMTVLWKPVVQKIGPRKSWLISMSIWIVTLLPLMFIGDMISGLIVFFLIGIGLSGSLYIIDLVISDIVDEDEVNTGIRREGAYYGANMFLMHLSTVVVFLVIGPVFIISDWEMFDPLNITPEIIFGLRSLMAIFPSIALLIALFVIYKYPLHGERLKQVKELREKLHQEKKSKI